MELQNNPHIVIATPGRLAAHFDHADPQIMAAFENLQYLVMDEADQLLKDSYRFDLLNIAKHIPADRTTYLYSATMLDGIDKRTEIFEGDMLAEPKLKKEIKVFDVTEGFEKTIEGLK